MDFYLLAERPEDAPLLDPLLDRTFGLQRHQKTVYRLREGRAPVSGLSFVALDADHQLRASIRYWSIAIGQQTPALLLGPIAVEPVYQGKGMGKALIRYSLAEAKRRGHRLVVLVGEPAYYQPFGFKPAAPLGLLLPGPVELARFQALDLVAGALEGVSGMIGPGSDEEELLPKRSRLKRR